MESEQEYFPERINVIKVVSYDVESIRQNILSDNRASDGEMIVTLDDIIEMIHEFAKDDFGCGWGHEADLSDLIFQDESGGEY
jgi:hypothetical protein